MAASLDRGVSRTILAGGIALIGGGLAFLGVFAYLAATFNYPEILDGSAQDVLPALWPPGQSVGPPELFVVFFHSCQPVSVRSKPSAAVLRGPCAWDCSSPCWQRSAWC
jgi:hypothetical protein